MIQLKHAGIYVKDLQKESDFYKKVFNMHVICENAKQEDELIKDVLQNQSSSVMLTKLITDQGKQSGVGDMIELVQVNFPVEEVSKKNLFNIGSTHIALGVDDMDNTVKKILELGGKLVTKIHTMDNGNKCCFCADPEGNYLELIMRAKS